MASPRSTLPAPAQPEDDSRWNEGRTSREQYLYFQRLEDHLAWVREQGYNSHQGRPGEVMPYRKDSPLAHLNPRQDQMEALARWASADPADRGERPSVLNTDPEGRLVDGTDNTRWWDETIPLPWQAGLSDIRDRDA